MAVMRIIVWSFNCLAKGLYPPEDHDQQPFANESRFNLRGFDLTADKLCGALCEYRADLLEMIDSLGFTRWNSVRNP
eukprot:2465415-Pyramimonas_sp.AAC.1